MPWADMIAKLKPHASSLGEPVVSASTDVHSIYMAAPEDQRIASSDERAKLGTRLLEAMETVDRKHANAIANIPKRSQIADFRANAEFMDAGRDTSPELRAGSHCRCSPK